MRIDKTHRPWMNATILLFVIATVGYIIYALSSVKGPSGGSVVGLIYGIAGYGMMLYAGLLGARKKRPVWRIGKAQTWMRGHLWLGLLSFPIILYHAGFAWKGMLTEVMMILFFIVILSGLVGAALQHYLPHALTQRIPLETIYEEIPHVRKQLRDEADMLVSSICGPMGDNAIVAAEQADLSPAVATAGVTVLVEVEPEDKEHFREVYVGKIRPFLENPDSKSLELANPRLSEGVFTGLRKLLPSEVHSVVDDLENICEEERQLHRQRGMYQWLHGWLIVHVPLSIALLVLGGIHAIVALRY
jgi:hypothetical protein